MSTPAEDENRTVLRPAPAPAYGPLVGPPSGGPTQGSRAGSTAAYTSAPASAASTDPLVGAAPRRAAAPPRPSGEQASYQSAQPSAAPVPAAATVEHNPPAPHRGTDVQVAPAGTTPISDGGIATIGPVRPALMNGYPLSQRTGEPRRPALLAVSCGLFVLGSVIAAAGLVKVLWDAASVSRYHDAATVLHWVKPDPVSFLTIVMVLLIGVLGVLVVGAPSVAALNAWNGESRTRWFGVAAAGISLLTFLLNPWSMVSIVPVAVAAGLLWLPQARAYTDAWASIRPTGQTPLPQWDEDVHYGPLARYR